MVKLLPSTALKRIFELRRALTLDLATRHGPFAEAVVALRARWGVDPIVDVPPDVPDNEGGLALLPMPWPESLPPSPLPPTDIDGQVVSLLVPAEMAEGDPFQEEWCRDLRRLHDACVPASYRCGPPIGELPWITFLSACVKYDPPMSRLLEFAQGSSLIMVSVPPRRGPDDGEDRCLAHEPFVMIHPPIEEVPDPKAVEQAWVAFYEEVFALVGEAVRATHGIDLHALRREVAAAHPDVFDRHRARLAAADVRHLIRVDEETAEEDVAGAFKLLKATLPPSKPGRPNRDPLTCVQCAVWRDEGWSLAEIAKVFGWKVKYPPGQKPTSETARLHINEGRHILSQRNCPGYPGKPK